jgi:aspartate 1-decarboxylase
MPGDRLIVMAYAQLTPEEISTHRPTVVLVDENNRVVEIRGYNNPSETLTWA